jgi:calcium-independent phospholipase A2
MLALCGGGTRGLISLEVLAHIEMRTGGKRIHELFDVISGTSTGGLLALFFTVRKGAVAECRNMYYKLKDEVFSGVKHYNREKLEKVLQRYFPKDLKMSDIVGPK